jgi:murein L,D-transpeptidase YcbB/YkuD
MRGIGLAAALAAGLSFVPIARATTDIESALPPVDTADVVLPVVVMPEAPAGTPAIFPPPPPPGMVIAVPPVEAAPVTPAAVALPVVPAIDEAAIQTALRDMTGDRLVTVASRAADHAAIVQFYASRDHKPLWSTNGTATGQAKAAIERISRADYDGLQASDYDLPAFDSREPGKLAEADVRLTAAILAYARDAQIGRTIPSRISSLITITPIAQPAEAVLAQVAQSTDLAATLDGFNPTHDGYRGLQKKLAEVLARDGIGAAPIPSGPVVKVGMRDPRVPALRQRLSVAGDADNTVYDLALAEAVRMFQTRMSLPATGLIGPATVEALNGRTPNRQVNVIVSNMERWRWLPRELGERHIIVNIPEFMVRVVKSGEVIHATRVVVGKPETPTPVFSDQMDHIVVNPSWTVPPSIVRKEMLPLWQSNPSALAARGIQVIGNGPVPTFRQPPGERNALGRIKFMFPNQHAVYLHDTPSRHLFSASRRAFSHGCVRVHEPLKFGEKVFEAGLPGQDWSERRIAGLFGPSERYIRLTNHIPVHLVYMNAWVDEQGELVVREDLYGFDSRTQTALKVANRGIETADTVPAPRRTSDRRQRTSGVQSPATTSTTR